MEKAYLDVTQEDLINPAGQLRSFLLPRNDSGRVAPLKNLTGSNTNHIDSSDKTGQATSIEQFISRNSD